MAKCNVCNGNLTYQDNDLVCDNCHLVWHRCNTGEGCILDKRPKQGSVSQEKTS